MRDQQVKVATILSGQSLSQAINVQGYAVVSVQFPATWNAADLTFQGSVDGVTFGDVYDEDGTEIGWTGDTASRVLLVKGTGELPAGLAAIKVRSGTAGVPVNQAADRALLLGLLPVNR
jgi:hypothetical protein